MRSYLLRRILLFIPTLLVISLVSFIILVNSPGDPVERMMQAGGTGELVPSGLQEKQRAALRHELGLDLPVFYFDMHSYGGHGIRKFIPAVAFHSRNQFHRWLFGDGIHTKGILRGDFGASYQTRQPVSTLISERIGWSLFFTLFSIFLAYLISIPIGIKSAAQKNSRFDRITSTVLFILYSLPLFWVATLLLMTFANPDVYFVFPASGVKPVSGYPEGANFLQRIHISLPYLVLPTVCYTYSSITFLSRLMRGSMLEILGSDFIRTARAKGLGEKKILWKHALKNSLFPVITVFAHVFPAMIGGSVIIESIFTIPGMGNAIYQSISTQDYPVLIAVFTITGLLTATGYLVSDILYAWVDPRISFSK
jgi:peptide/nickel transport system permease protein